MLYEMASSLTPRTASIESPDHLDKGDISARGRGEGEGEAWETDAFRLEAFEYMTVVRGFLFGKLLLLNAVYV